MSPLWSEQNLYKAIEFMLNGGNLNTVEKMFKVPRTTVQRRGNLVHLGVPIEMACKKGLKQNDFAHLLKSGDKNKADENSEKPNCVIKAISDSSEKSCSVPHCSSDSTQDSTLAFFRLPNNNTKATKWAKQCGKPEWADPAKIEFAKKYTLICAHHFADNMFLDKEHKLLKEDSVPSVVIRNDESRTLNGSTPVIPSNHNGFIIADDPLKFDLEDPLSFENVKSMTEETTNLSAEVKLPLTDPTLLADKMDENNLNQTNPQVDTVSDSKLFDQKFLDDQLKIEKEILVSHLNSNVDKNEVKHKAKTKVNKNKLNHKMLRFGTPSIIIKKRQKKGPSHVQNVVQIKRKMPVQCIASSNCKKFCKEGQVICVSCAGLGFLSCAVRSCSQLYNKKENNKSYVYFPTQRALKSKWKKILGKPENWDSDRSVVCLSHFRKPNDFVTGPDGPTLKLDACPTVASVKSVKKSVATWVPQKIPMIITEKPPENTGTSNGINDRKSIKTQKRNLYYLKERLTIKNLRLRNQQIKLQNERLKLQNRLLQIQLEANSSC